MRAILIFAASAAALVSAAAQAGETVTYSYDAKGRLTQVQHAGGPTDGLTSSYAFDAADNRSSSQVTGVKQMIVVPSGSGFLIIPTG